MQSDFWNDKEKAQSVLKNLQINKSKVEEWESINNALYDLKELDEMLDENDEEYKELQEDIKNLSIRIKNF